MHTTVSIASMQQHVLGCVSAMNCAKVELYISYEASIVSACTTSIAVRATSTRQGFHCRPHKHGTNHMLGIAVTAHETCELEFAFPSRKHELITHTCSAAFHLCFSEVEVEALAQIVHTAWACLEGGTATALHHLNQQHNSVCMFAAGQEALYA